VTETVLRDLKLVGTTSASGGRFGNVRITGEAVLSGVTVCRSLKCVGTVGIQGDLQADFLKLTGECRVHGNLRSSRIRAMGELTVSGDVTGNRIKLMGGIRVSGNCEADEILLSGALDMEGLLNADQVDIRMHGPCRAKEIGGGTVTVKRSRANWFKSILTSGGHEELTAVLIEGDTVHLEHTHAPVVRGNRVTIGPGCRIDKVEYRSELQIEKNAIVREQIRV
jgi:cytoskeletal protein CcmA (bactofilin family)